MKNTLQQILEMKSRIEFLTNELKCGYLQTRQKDKVRDRILKLREDLYVLEHE